MADQIKTIIDGVGICGERVKTGTIIDVVPDDILAADKPAGAIRKAVAVGLVAKKRAEVVKGASAAATPAAK